MAPRAVLTEHNKKQKEAARKRGPSLKDKTRKLGLKANIRTAVFYEDPTHGVWHMASHCPAGKTLPDLNALLEEYQRTEKEPRVQSCVGINVTRQRPNSSNTTRPRPVRQARRTSRYGQRQGGTQHASARYGDVYDVPDDDDSQTLCAGASCGGESSGEYDGCVQSSFNVADEDADGIDNVDDANDANDAADERNTEPLLSETNDCVGSAEGMPPVEDMGLLDDGMLLDDMAGIDAGIEELEDGNFLEAIEGMEEGSAMNADGQDVSPASAATESNKEIPTASEVRSVRRG